MTFLPTYHPLHRFSCLLLFVGLLAGCQSSPDIDREARDLLEKVEHRYGSAENFRLNALITTEISSGRRNQTIEIPLTYAVSAPGKMRLEIDHDMANVTLVSNGSTTWTYLASDKQYTRKQASTLRKEGSGPSADPTDEQFLQLARSLTETYADITDKLNSASITNRPQLTVNEQAVDTYLVEATYEDDLKSERPDASIAPTKYWIDSSRHLVLKQFDEYTLPSRRTGDSVRVRETTLIKEYEMDPSFSSKTFSFQPPADAERVDKLSIDASGGASMEGREAPSFTLPNLEGEEISLEEFRGKVVLLDFWASWCAPCRRAHPDIQELHKKYKDQGLVVLGINNESRSKAKTYMSEHDYTFRTLLDTNDMVSRRYNVSAIPYYIVIDRQGTISSEIIGYHPKSDMLEALREAGLDVN